MLGGVLAVPPNATLGPPPVWGRLTGLEEPVVEAWSSNVDLVADEQAFEVHLLADVVLVPVRAFDPDLRPVASTILAFDAHDGALLWTLSEETLTCARPQTSLVCVTGSGADASILSIDLTTGDVRRTAAPQALAAAEHDGDLIVLRADPDGERVIRYRGWTTANEQWRRVVGPIAGETSYYRRSIEPSAGQLVISSTRGAVLDADTGEVLLENTTAYKVSDDVVVVAEPNGGQLRFYPLHGNDVITRPRDASPICVDDDPRADLYISRLPDQPTAVSASTGDTLWTAAIADSPAHTVARQRGTIIVRTEANLYGLDATTGDQL
ncbi:outer membrane protein assembly factor BamB family protein [Occultella gossypii]|uniref:PQQ-binding-like beta-propeller repeat protein n=1 Tax=Occultella gossypii TaxID=2800820 RepID=A0ABS7SHI1_9MICO|nr:PQQ-binding-like beta-propeller repeat protein [Occultella gossypii]MBZ2198713.1 PQQ-binding-like beta-propeller repeat protein [Occultella gossypii]